MTSFNRRVSRHDAAGVAIIIVLVFVVLLAATVIAYLSRTSTDRVIAHGDFNDAKSDVLARSALDLIVADLKEEIVDGSAASTVGSYTQYTPTTNANMIPIRSGNPAGNPDPIPNLVRRSVRNDPITAPGISSRACAVNSTTDISLNSRSVSTARWNKHYLIPRRNSGSTTVDSTPVATFTPPDWVFVTENGPTVITSPRSTPNGRYAYAIYDEGGLMDVNVGGYPSPTPSPAPATYVQAIGRKGSLGFSDLSVIGISPRGVGDLVAWRDYASVRPAGSLTSFTFDAAAVARFASFIKSNGNGFLTVDSTTWNGRTNQAFVSRQHLLDFRRTSGFSQDAMQFLTTFSRELDIPSASPASPTTTNPDFRMLRVATSFTRNDGTTAHPGEPLVNQRFLLQRLNWLTYKGPSASRTIPASSPAPSVSNADYDMWALANTYDLSTAFLAQGTAANIINYFGLAWDSTNERWNYVGHGGSSTPISAIDSLSSLAATREPDFLELLQAAILDGSLGDSATSSFPTTQQQSKTFQVLTIAANLISQVTIDSYPTRIAGSVGGVTMEAVGNERLPYVNMLAFCPVGSSLSTGGVTWFLVPNLWDPYRNTSDMVTGPLRPAIQIVVTGKVGFGAVSGGTTTAVSSTVPTPTATSMTALLLSGSAAGGRDKVTSGYPEAARLDLGDLPAAVVAPTPSTFNAFPFGSESSNGATASIGWRTTNALSGASRYVVMRAGHPGTAITPAIIGQNPALILNPNNSSSEAFQISLDYQSPTNSAKWYSYSFLQGNNDRSTWMGKVQITDTTDVYASPTVAPSPTATPYQTNTIAMAGNVSQITSWSMSSLNVAKTFIKSDPRSTRFNSIIDTLSDATASPTPIAAVVNSIWPSGTTPALLGSGATNPALLAQNTNSYADTDGQIRAADNGPSGSNPYRVTATLTSGWGDPVRPLIINRPFRSVAEMGYAFRDQPFKTVDFLTTDSADSALLDLFCVNDNSNASRLRSGVVNLNTRQSAVLAAMVARALQRDDSTSSDVNSTDANSVGAVIVAATNTMPLTNRSALVATVANDATLSLTKTQHEVIIRAIADAGQTRTWNFLIDVIAQSGRYPPTAASLSDFVVEGEKRYWLHVAIDRFTGEVIDHQLEAVYE